MVEVAVEQFEHANEPASPRPMPRHAPRSLFDLRFGIYLAFWVALLIAGETAFFQDPGTFWHTVVGSQILDSGTFVTHDSFTFTRHGEPWIAHQWLGDVVLA